jgi:hypothetical protein
MAFSISEGYWTIWKGDIHRRYKRNEPFNRLLGLFQEQKNRFKAIEVQKDFGIKIHNIQFAKQLE